MVDKFSGLWSQTQISKVGNESLATVKQLRQLLAAQVSQSCVGVSSVTSFAPQ